MGRYINPDQPMSDEDKEFLRSRARADEVTENERRFPPGGEPAKHEAAGFMPTKVGYDYETQAEKTEDAIGLPVQRIPTDEHGRPMTAEYGYGDPADFDIDDHTETVDESPVTEPASEPADDSEKKDEPADEEGGIDDDILESVIDLTVEELKDKLEKLGEKKSGNKDELVERLANRLQDDREKANEATA